MWQGRQSVWALVALAALVAAVVVTVANVTRKPKAALAQAWFSCTSDGYYFLGPNEDPPLKCPRCGKQTAWPAMKCMTCGNIVGVDRHQAHLHGAAGEPVCPVCSSTTLKMIRASADLPPPPPPPPVGNDE